MPFIYGVVWCGVLRTGFGGLLCTKKSFYAPVRPSIGEQVMECHICPDLFWRRNKLIYIKCKSLLFNMGPI